MLLAIITKTICFSFANTPVTILEGTEVEIDVDEGLATIGGYSFDIARDEYAAIN